MRTHFPMLSAVFCCLLCCAAMAAGATGATASETGKATASPDGQSQAVAPGDASALRPGDVLSVSVFRVAEFSREVRVEEDGMFRYPFCGEIRAAGMTPSMVARELEKRLAMQIANPQVDVFVKEWGPRTVYILGEVNNSMSLSLPTYEKMTALQAISAAGGFTESADLKHVAVLRRVGAKRERLVRLPIDVSALVSQSSGGDDFRLLPEDTLIVPKASPVFVSGLVAKTGTMNIDTQRPPMVSELLIRMGGMLEGADESRIIVTRMQENGGHQLLTVSLKQNENGETENDLCLQPGDAVWVPSARQIYVLGEVKNPGPLKLRPGQTVTASQAVALAGGFLVTAKQGDITLVRGKEFRRLNLKSLYESEKSMQRDEELQDGDILFVKESLW